MLLVGYYVTGQYMTYSGCHITDWLDVDIGIYIEHVAYSVIVYTNMSLFETIILMFLCIGEYSVTY